jgi:hypothetical protein
MRKNTGSIVKKQLPYPQKEYTMGVGFRAKTGLHYESAKHENKIFRRRSLQLLKEGHYNGCKQYGYVYGTTDSKFFRARWNYYYMSAT